MINRNCVRTFHTGVRCLRESHYDILKLPHDASMSDIKNKFKKLSLKLHPDMLKSQDLSEDELQSKLDHYLKVKKSYETLSDEKKRDEYDLRFGFKRREGTSQNSYIRRPGNSFHFHERKKANDVPHFDTKKHQARNERTEKRFMYNQKINQDVDTFSRDLYKRNIAAHGPRKGIYREYSRQPNVRDDEGEGKKIAIRLAGGIAGIFAIWYILCGKFSTVDEEHKTKVKESNKNQVEKAEQTIEPSEVKETNKETKNSVSRSGATMNVNNAYGLMLIKGESNKRDDLEVLEEQISETAE